MKFRSQPYIWRSSEESLPLSGRKLNSSFDFGLLMATTGLSSTSPIASTLFLRKIRREFLLQNKLSLIGENQKPLSRSLTCVNFPIDSRLSLVTSISRRSSARAAPSDEYLEECETLPSFEENPLKFGFLVLVWASISLAWFAASADANAAADSIRASSFGLKVASALRNSGWPDEAVVFALATLPVIELRGAIPVGYWMQLKPVLLTVLSILGNMVPVPFIILYLKRFASFLAGKNKSASRFLDILFERAKEKAGPVQEFQWLGLMLFVAVPFPGTGAWTGAIIASVLDMPFWSAFSANFFGVVLAGLLVNLLVNLGLKSAVITGIALFCVSTFMWSILRSIRKSLSS